MLSYLPALNIMFAFGDLFSQTDQKDLAEVIYNQALVRYTNIQGPSSKRCKQLKDQLQALRAAFTKSEIGEDKSTEVRAHKSSTEIPQVRKAVECWIGHCEWKYITH